ncbi:MAG TPA: efflux RND transporter periplasmic adaptor subunit [Dinghuibacter sp.]|uniref:efflux RND transporter periplasmic adaptor subunit n=1 Tax=Dinghuibacter sp. TaxID=2024697 RepID=UPI002CC64CED|nr:efflux RND transporter periplasmic adaptor subunit [Dinghuibacter sp.]HTJ13446.1 efflux RND transporter periplasmic adaptor subunit [Dinghuibacter sp.]
MKQFIPLLFLLAACGHGSVVAPAAVKDSVFVQTFPLSKGQLTTAMSLPGQLLPFQTVDLYAKVPSFVKDMYVDVGSKVQRGQLLATLEAPELQASRSASESLLHTQEALYRASKATYDRLYATSRIPGTISPNELEIALGKMGSDSANLAAARSKYQEATDLQSYLEVRAPFDGIISARNTYPGAYAGQGVATPLMTLQEQARLRLVIDVPEVATAYFRNKDTVRFTVSTLPGRTFSAVVTRMAGAVDPSLRTENIQMDVVNSHGELLPGMFAQVSSNLVGSPDVFVVPLSAVTGNSRDIFVIRVRRGVTEWVPVQKGRTSGGKVEVYGDLATGDSLIATATDELKQGTPVFVKQ